MSRCCVVKVITLTEIQLLQVGGVTATTGRGMVVGGEGGTEPWIALKKKCIYLWLDASVWASVIARSYIQTGWDDVVSRSFLNHFCIPLSSAPQISQSMVCGHSDLLVSMLSTNTLCMSDQGFFFFGSTFILSLQNKDGKMIILSLCQHVEKYSVFLGGRNERSLFGFVHAFFNGSMSTLNHCFISCCIFLKWKENLGKTESVFSKSRIRGSCEFVRVHGRMRAEC